MPHPSQWPSTPKEIVHSDFPRQLHFLQTSYSNIRRLLLVCGSVVSKLKASTEADTDKDGRRKEGGALGSAFSLKPPGASLLLFTDQSERWWIGLDTGVGTGRSDLETQ